MPHVRVSGLAPTNCSEWNFISPLPNSLDMYFGSCLVSMITTTNSASALTKTSKAPNLSLGTVVYSKRCSAEEQGRWSHLSNQLKLKREFKEQEFIHHSLSSLGKVMESRKLTVDADFATSALCDYWNIKEEKSIISHSQFSVTCSEGSTNSIGSISSSSLCDDDALSPFSSSSSSSSCSSLSSTSSLLSQNELREQQLPIKKGLSKYYEGKSRTFSSLSDVKSIEDLAKRGRDYRKKGTRISPKAAISKKHGRSCFATLVSKADTLL